MLISSLRSKVHRHIQQLAFSTSQAVEMAKPVTVNAGILIIGDEILKGQVKDTNTHFLTQNLYSLGVKVERISVLPDQIDIIAEEVLDFSSKYTYVLTSGGIGPTHDDVTFEAIAKAFGDEVQANQDIIDALKRYFKTDFLTEGMIKLATIPKTAKLNFSPSSSTSQDLLKYPLISVRNVYIFPGIPELLRKAFNHIACHLLDHSEMKRTTHEHFLTKTEVYIASALNELVHNYTEKGVVFGSYPIMTNNYYKVRLTVEAGDLELLAEVDKAVIERLPVIEAFDNNPSVNSMEKLKSFLNKSDLEPEFVAKVTDSLNTIEECFNRYKSEQVVVAFNGGKDCIVVLHLVHAFWRNRENSKNEKIQVLYVQDDEPFPEVSHFIETSKDVYNLDVISVSRPMKLGLQNMLTARPAIQAAILGTRTGDPNASSQDKFSPTDSDWPTLMRVNPIIGWNYSDVWTFIRGLCLAYPGLYDRGYTSLGDKNNTLPNPSLAETDADGNVVYKPAFQLHDGSLERTGRN